MRTIGVSPTEALIFPDPGGELMMPLLGFFSAGLAIIGGRSSPTLRSGSRSSASSAGSRKWSPPTTCGCA